MLGNMDIIITILLFFCGIISGWVFASKKWRYLIVAVLLGLIFIVDIWRASTLPIRSRALYDVRCVSGLVLGLFAFGFLNGVYHALSGKERNTESKNSSSDK